MYIAVLVLKEQHC